MTVWVIRKGPGHLVGCGMILLGEVFPYQAPTFQVLWDKAPYGFQQTFIVLSLLTHF